MTIVVVLIDWRDSSGLELMGKYNRFRTKLNYEM